MQRHDGRGTEYPSKPRPGRHPAPEMNATARTILLHRMLVLRYVGLLSRAPAGATAEAIVTGIGTALSPGDGVLVIGGRPDVPMSPADTGVTVRLAHFAGSAGPERICALFSHRCQDRIRRTVTVDGWDVEAVAAAASGAMCALRLRDSACLLTLPTGSGRRRPDAVAVLAGRMRGAHQLDDNALAAIEADARRVAKRLLHDRARGRTTVDTALSTLAVAAGDLIPCFTPASADRKIR